MARKNGKADEPEESGLEIIGTAKSLDDGLTYEAEITVELPNNKALIYKMRTLSIGEWNDIGASVPEPSPPVSGFKKGDKPEPIYNEHDAGYLAARSAAEQTRNYRRLATALLIDIPGETLEERGDILGAKMDAGTVRQLLSALLALTFGGVSRLDRRAESFHTNGTGHPDGAADVGDTDESGVERALDG